jgi:hypothetical protein
VPDIDDLRELSGQLRRPPFDDLLAVSRQRRRRSVLGGTAGVAAMVAVVAVAAAGLSDGPRVQEPVPQPSPSVIESPTNSTEWTPERFRAEGEPRVLVPMTETGLTATQYVACSGICEGELTNRALEVTQGEQSALFEVRGLEMAFSPVWVKVFDQDSLLVQDAAEVGRPKGPVRFRLLQADGTAVELEVLDDLAPALPGPGVFVIDPYAAWSHGSVGPDDRQQLYLVDDSDASMRLLDVPEEVEQWAPDVDEVLWGARGCRVVWQQPGGGFDQHDVDCRSPGLTSLPEGYWTYLGSWFQPGRMMLLEHNANGIPLVVHASLDYGATWQRVEVEDRGWDDSTTLADTAVAVVQALGELE